jgi:glutaredoxin
MEATLYTKDNCPHCVHAKMMLNNRGYQITEINALENKAQLVEAVTRETGTPPQTVPQIWLGEQYIGGACELQAYFKNQ